MTYLAWLLSSRGVDLRYLALLIASTMTAWLATEVTVELRTPADRAVQADTLDSAVLVGLVLPVAVLARSLQNRLAWLAETAARSVRTERAIWFGLVAGVGAVLCAGIVVLAPDQLLTTLIVCDFFVLLGLAVLCAVTLGAGRAWVAPSVAALVFSTPGVVPVRWNVLANGDLQSSAIALAVVLLVSAAVAYVAFDDYGLDRRARLIERTPGVTEE